MIVTSYVDIGRCSATESTISITSFGAWYNVTSSEPLPLIVVGFSSSLVSKLGVTIWTLSRPPSPFPMEDIRSRYNILLVIR